MPMVALPIIPNWLDTVERAIVWSATLLRASNLAQGADFAYRNAIRISSTLDKSESDYIGLLNLEFNLLYSSEIFLLSGGDFLAAILPFSNSEKPIFNYACTSTIDGAENLAQADNLTTLEQFLFWACWILYASLPLNNSYISFQFYEENSGGAVAQFKVKLPFDYAAWIEDKNIICNLNRVVQTYVYPQGTYLIEANSLGNTSSFGNNFIVGN